MRNEISVLQSLSGGTRFLLYLALGSSVMFLILHGTLSSFPGSFALKAVPALTLAVLVGRSNRNPQGWLVTAGLLFSMGGDIVLDIDRVNLFLMGLVLFLIAHLFYIMAFARDYAFRKKMVIPVLAVLIYALVIGFFLKDIRPDRVIPVMLYLAIISIMTMFALSMNPVRKTVAVGAVLFMISDTIIAINQFLYPIPNSTVINISIYYAAQFCIATGFMIPVKRQFPGTVD